MLAILAVILSLGLLVGIHEACHMFVAKLFGVRVIRFSFGFGTLLLSYQTKETSYELRLLPLGGFVQFDGEDPDHPEVGGFFGLPWYKRALVALAGPIANLILGFILLAALLIGFKHWPVLDGLQRAGKISLLVVTETLKYLGGLFGGASKVSDMSGPVGVTTAMAKSFKSGAVDFTFILSIISLSLGLFNLFPIPGLDGGHVFLYLIEGIRGKRLPAKAYVAWSIVGFVLLGLLMLLMIGMDIFKLMK